MFLQHLLVLQLRIVLFSFNLHISNLTIITTVAHENEKIIKKAEKTAKNWLKWQCSWLFLVEIKLRACIAAAHLLVSFIIVLFCTCIKLVVGSGAQRFYSVLFARFYISECSSCVCTDESPSLRHNFVYSYGTKQSYVSLGLRVFCVLFGLVVPPPPSLPVYN